MRGETDYERLADVLYAVASWQRETFPDGTAHGALQHLREEAMELIEAIESEHATPHDVATELFDVLSLGLAYCRHQGIAFDDVSAQKLDRNRRRTFVKNTLGYSKGDG